MKKTTAFVLYIIAVIAIIGFGIMAYKYNSLIKNNDHQNDDQIIATTTDTEPQNSTSTNIIWNKYLDSSNDISINYPSLNNVDLKPNIATTSKKDLDSNGCLPGQLEDGTMSTDILVTLNSIKFCGSQITGAGMSHRYNVYYYTFLHNGNYYTLSYDASTVVCEVYDIGSDGFQSCEAKKKALPSLIPLIQQSLSTLHFN